MNALLKKLQVKDASAAAAPGSLYVIQAPEEFAPHVEAWADHGTVATSLASMKARLSQKELQALQG